MKAEIRRITWNEKTYYKVYAENLNGRMTLVSKTKFETLEKATEFAKVMLPSHDLRTIVRDMRFV